jgi:glycosyltransferase involved in cell wall biosynthesis
MRFLMLNWRDPKNPKAGGAERVSLAYLAALVQRGHDVCWFANDFPGGAPEEVIDGIRFVRGGGKGTSVVRAMQWYRRQQPFDLVIDQHHGIPWFAPWWSETKCIAYIHEVLGPIWHAFYRWPLSTIGRSQERWTHWLYRNVPFWVPSESTRTALHSHGVRNVTVIPNGTDTSPIPALEDKPLVGPLRLAAVSRLAPNKRVDHAIRAAHVLVQRNLPTQLTIVGTGEVENELKGLARDLGIEKQVSFTGQIGEAEKNAQLRAAHFLVHTSIREGWGLNVIEANAMGTPAVVYPVGGLVDSTVHEQTGIVTPSETPLDLANCLIAILQTPEAYARLRLNAWQRAKTFQWAQVLPRACAWLEEQAAQA